MSVASITSYNIGVLRTLALARNVAAIYETEASSGSERDRTAVLALRLFADQAAVLLLPEPKAAGASEEEADG